MKEFTGVPSGISQPIMGMITTRSLDLLGGHNLVQVIKGQNQIQKIFPGSFIRQHLVAYIFSDDIRLSSLSGIPCLSNVTQEVCNTFNDGDLVLIEPPGKATILYMANSPHNALFVTNRCNCSCIMCPQPPTNEKENLLELNLNLISLFGKIKPQHLGITGGEPTLLGDNLIKLISACRERLPNTSLTLLTNGRKLQDLEFSKTLAKAGGLNMVIEVPLFSDNDTEHDSITGAKGSFYETLQGLYNLALLNQPVGLRMVLHALTINRLTQYAEFIYRNLPFVINVAFMGMETTGFAEKNLDLLWIDPFEYRHKLADAVKYLVRRNMVVSIYNHQLCTLPCDLWPFAKRSISTWKETYITTCNECIEKENCCGIFGTGKKQSAFLHPIKN